jgi:hypothetical protein
MLPDAWNEFLPLYSSEISRFTPSLFKYVSGQWDHLGSGVLLQVGDVRFLLTAAHVADEFRLRYKKVFFGTLTGEDVLPLEGDRMVFSKVRTDPNREDDPVDMAVVELTSKVANKLSTYMRFLTLNDLLLDPVKLKDGSYLVNGYPDFRADRDEMDEIIVTQNLPFMTMLYDIDRSPAPNLNSIDHIALEVDPPYESGGVSYGLDLDKANGISGCGIWRMLDEGKPIESLDWRQAKLVAIVTDRSDPDSTEPLQYLRGTKIKHAIRMIWGGWPQLQAEIESAIPGRFVNDPA